MVTGNDQIEMSQLKHQLAQEFEIKDLGPLHYFLRIKVARSAKGLFLSQRKYTLDRLAKTSMISCKASDTYISQSSQY